MEIKRHIKNAGILVVVFVVAVIVFSYFTNRGNDNMTADMGAATFPQITFSCGEYTVNTLSGYAEEMEITSVRDVITPVTKGRLEANILAYDNKINSIRYRVYTLDGAEELKNDKITKPEKSVILSLEEEGLLEEERILEIKLNIVDSQPVYFYTRIVDGTGKNLSECLNYISDFHENALDKAEGTGIGTAIEPNEDADNATLQHVTIYSDYDHVTWGDLEPQVEGGERWNIKELNGSYAAVQLEYRVRGKGEENETDLYQVKEFFKVRYAPDAQKTYLLGYDRTMDQIFDATKTVVSEKGLLLGIASRDIPYLVNKDGTIVSFVEADELWNYNKESDELSLVFGFADAENTDARSMVSDHEIRLLKVDEEGNTAFVVSGYMNRGEHEGEVGVAVYYYDIAKNSVEEKAFISSRESYASVIRELGRSTYYDEERNVLYFVSEGTLYQYDVKMEETEILAEGLTEKQYVISDDGKVIAYQADGDLENASEVIVLNFDTGKQRSVTCEKGETIRPLGFVRTDFVYGIARTDDAGTTISGETTIPMYKIEIQSQKGEVIKEYQSDGIYILDALFGEDMITLERASKDGSMYVKTAPDYITNNEEKTKSNIVLETYSTDLKQRQIRLTYNEGISDKEPKVLKPKQILFEQPKRVVLEQTKNTEKYYVYGNGELQGIYTTAGEAIRAADSFSGVVVASDQSYIWERSNRDIQYSIEGKAEIVEAIQNRLKANEASADIMKDINGGTFLDLTGCTTEELLYIINQDRPIIAMLDNRQAVILVGYSDTTVSYIDVESGERRSASYEQMDQMTQGSGNTFIG